ncbi:TetR family transcriptional regulator, partial [Streptomyces sp. NRRL WC-3753]
MFAAQGYDATTTAAVAERAGVSEMTLFRHFATKEALLLE